MKKLILVRHAKSDWPAGVEDLKRPLSERGKKDAPKMAAYLKRHSIAIDLMISSPAKRAFKTCLAFGEVYEESRITRNPLLYHASVADFYEVIMDIPDLYESVALFSHNFGISDFASSFADQKSITMPTCGVVGVELQLDSWKDFNQEQGHVAYFFRPKEIK